MARFQKSKSSYTKSTFHQTVDGGVIKERDWPTLAGDRQRVEPGKAPVYSYGNFLFTTSTIRGYRNRRKTSTTETVYGYDDVEDSTDGVNSIQPSSDSRDVRDFAYFGSAVELVRASVEAIINEFPGSITGSYEQLKYDVGDDDYVMDDKDIPLNMNCILNNPFNIDMIHDTVVLGEYDNPYRFLAINNADFLVNGSPISNYEVSDWQCESDAATRNCECQYDRYKKPVYTITITTEDNNSYTIYA
ncbi:MAG: hypothetical protein LUD72_06155, partial [Bacteroidales bacterium]|nr:hypothetical protein [Bacteroidales bacterium]